MRSWLCRNPTSSCTHRRAWSDGSGQLGTGVGAPGACSSPRQAARRPEAEAGARAHQTGPHPGLGTRFPERKRPCSRLGFDRLKPPPCRAGSHRGPEPPTVTSSGRVPSGPSSPLCQQTWSLGRSQAPDGGACAGAAKVGSGWGTRAAVLTLGPFRGCPRGCSQPEGRGEGAGGPSARVSRVLGLWGGCRGGWKWGANSQPCCTAPPAGT